ncbi:unnamed protein product [Cuscuta europaea]|uniref:Uncharacterized protein n=1 Tax=Cuscuta europaea TaxID=41803 RepID=A0A9P0YZG1_CUSEU|nr:unnamed protein product [Cuscuta europaea]
MLAFESHYCLKQKRQGKIGICCSEMTLGLRREMGTVDYGVCYIGLYFTPFDDSKIGPISPERWLRQEHPLSTYLFVLIEEGLSVLLQIHEATGRFHGESYCSGAPRITHFLQMAICYYLKLIMRKLLL